MHPPTPDSALPGSATKRAQPSTPRPRVKKPQATFTTSLSFPEPPTAATAAVAHDPTKATAELKRNMRKSKVDALSKLDKSNMNADKIEREREKLGQNGATATSLFPSSFASGSGTSTPAGTAGSGNEPGPARNPLLKKAALKPAPALDMDTVKTRTDVPRHPTPRTRPRMFGLEDCPTFYPTAEEFKDPMRYIDWVGNEGQGKACGIAKIVPPEGWEMPFVLDTELFRFKTRLQRLNSIEASSRAKVNFLDQLYMYHKQQGDAKVTIPIIEHKTLDLWALRKEVNRLGGLNEVNKTKAWPAISTTLGYSAYMAPHVRSAYTRIILPFDDFSVRARSVTGSPLTPLTTPGSVPAPASRMGRMTSAGLAPSPALAHMSASKLSMPVSEPSSLLPPHEFSPSKVRISGFEGSESELSEAEESSRGSPVRKGTKRSKANGTATKGEECEVCHSGEDGTKILLCDGCDQGYHIYCLEPPLPAVPTHEQWYCTACLFGTGNDYGFDEGEEHSIHSFQLRDKAFREAWFETHPPASASPMEWGPSVITENDVETEFWRLVESQHETVEVEYGADVHSTTHGSGAPTLETDPLAPYSADPWNLNNMPILPDSLLRYIKSDISGMTVPWIYIGMLFSTFCWHNEDHYTYSINYMFWGETKTWYGIPGADADKFEQAMKSEAPELFEQQPALLYQLVTMMNPGRVKQAGVNVVACDQRPNEFVLTFPKAYHCGFNHGLNFNEAVNFALPDWLPDGAESVERYQHHAKQPVFSHDELLITITEHSDTIKTAMWLRDSLEKMVLGELAKRRKILADAPSMHVKLEEEDCPEDQYQCCICKGFCYLSQITCSCTTRVSCLSHANDLCTCPASNRTLRNRFSDADLTDLRLRISTRATQPKVWQGRLRKLLDESDRPPLKSLRALLAEGEKILYPIEELPTLRSFVECGNAWVEAAVQIMARKATARRKMKKARRSEIESLLPPDVDDDEKDMVERTPAAVEKLLDEASRLGFDTPEIAQLRALNLSIKEFEAQAADILRRPESECSFSQVESAFIIGSALNMDLPQLAPLEMIYKRLRWIRDLEEEVDDARLELADVERFIAEAKEFGIPPDHKLVDLLHIRRDRGYAWKKNAEECLAQPKQTIADYNRWMKVEDGTPTVEEVMRKLEAAKKQALSWQTSARAILDSQRTGGNKGIADIRKLFKNVSGPAASIEIEELETLRTELQLHTEWNEALCQLLRCAQSKINVTLQDILTNVQDKLNPADDSPWTPGQRMIAPPVDGESVTATVPVAKDTFTCYCRGPASKTMVTCGSCQAPYHPRCLGIAPRSALKDGFNYTCHMCEAKKPFREKDIERPSLHALAMMADRSKWKFSFPPPELTIIESIATAAVRFACLLVPVIDPMGEGTQSRNVTVIQHYIRKLHMLPVVFDSVHMGTEDQVIFEDWLFKRLDQAHKEPKEEKKRVRARRPKFKFINDRSDRGNDNNVVRCVCRTESADWDPAVLIKCAKCSLVYHRACVNALHVDVEVTKWKCVACHARAGTRYPNAILRVQHTADIGTDVVIDTKKTLIDFYNLVKTTVPVKPLDICVVLEVVGFVPGEKPEDRTGSVADRAEPGTPSEASTSAPKRRKVEKLAKPLVEHTTPKESESGSGSHLAPGQATYAPVLSAPPLSTPRSTAAPESPVPKPLNFGHVAQAPPYLPYSPVTRYDEGGSERSATATPSFLDEPLASRASAAKVKNGEQSSSSSPYQTSRPSSALSAQRLEPVRKDTWSPYGDRRWSSSFAPPMSSYPPVLAEYRQQEAAQRASILKRSRSPESTDHVIPNGSRPRTEARQLSPLPTALTFGQPKLEAPLGTPSSPAATSGSIPAPTSAVGPGLTPAPAPPIKAKTPSPLSDNKHIGRAPAPVSAEKLAVRLDRWVG